ncbi:hypothetical protein SK128_026731 [Halocaridina rubra]|uniref:Methylated-DNA--protein-cysteine methyltransferase n=1 Tax=Halocaridina rubra TaxID=373956 RepID=A0AAN8X801_HALRR
MATNVCKLSKFSLESCLFTSPLGLINVSACSQGLHSMGLEEDLTDANFSPKEITDVQVLGKKSQDLSEIMETCHEWLQHYFTDLKNLSRVPSPDICAFKQKELAFRVKVWKTLKETVHPGEVITYGDLAKRLNNPGAVRAVGSAMRNNPTGIIVPCHRVVRANDMGLYSGGTRQSVKVWLLRHEGIDKYTMPEP